LSAFVLNPPFDIFFCLSALLPTCFGCFPQEVPFRLTRNVMTLLSPLLVDGLLASGMAAAALALADHAADLKPYLELWLRDDAAAWHASAAAPSDAEQVAGEAARASQVATNAQVVLERLEAAAPRVLLSPSPNPNDGLRVQREHRVDHKVHRLIEAAAQPERLCQMDPTWMPWL